jgi:hypothetical protein
MRARSAHRDPSAPDRDPIDSPVSVVKTALKGPEVVNRFPDLRHAATARSVVQPGNNTGYTPGMAKVMVSLPDDLLARIDHEAKRRSTSRSALLAVAASRELENRDSDEIADAITRSEERFRRTADFESADVIRRERDSRK